MRLGLIAPPTNTVNEAEWRAALPERFSIHVVRMPLHHAVDDSFYRDVEKALDELAPHQPEVIAYGCTAGSMVLPLDKLTKFMQARAGVPCVATAPALVEACRALGLRKIALATPYHDALNEHERAFFSEAGIEVVSLKGLGIGAGGPQEYVRIARVPPEEIHAHCRSVDVDAAEGLVVSCTDFPTLGLLPRLHAELGKPVMSSNSATLWAALRAAGVDQSLPRGSGFPSVR